MPPIVGDLVQLSNRSSRDQFGRVAFHSPERHLRSIDRHTRFLRSSQGCVIRTLFPQYSHPRIMVHGSVWLYIETTAWSHLTQKGFKEIRPIAQSHRQRKPSKMSEVYLRCGGYDCLFNCSLTITATNVKAAKLPREPITIPQPGKLCHSPIQRHIAIGRSRDQSTTGLTLALNRSLNIPHTSVESRIAPPLTHAQIGLKMDRSLSVGILHSFENAPYDVCHQSHSSMRLCPASIKQAHPLVS